MSWAPDPATLLLFSTAALALLVVPGPAVTYVVAQSIDKGRAAGLASVAGVHLGTMVHIAAAALGLSALVVSSAVAFDAVRYAGAAYLILIGIRSLMTRTKSAGSPIGDQPANLLRLVRQGAVVNILNPKTALFFLAFLPQFVDVSQGAVTAQILILGCLFALLGMLSDGAYALAAAAVRERLLDSPRLVAVRHRVTGITFIVLGIGAALTGRRTT